MKVKRLTRLLKLLQMLESGSDQTTITLAKACGVGRRTLFRDLESLREAGVPFEFDRRAYQLLFSRRNWYVIGRSSLHREVRVFNVARISSLKPLEERYTIPQRFDLGEYLGNAWHDERW
jgi:predicted DNA-binding transcriptional regulator YafY